MPYTLVMFLMWGVLMALIGVVIGWTLCRVKVRARERRPDPPHGRSHEASSR